MMVGDCATPEIDEGDEMSSEREEKTKKRENKQECISLELNHF